MCIKGGYILQPRVIDNSELIHEPPIVRELWLYILRKVNHNPDGKLKRGCGYFNLTDVAEDLHWYAGFRKMKYSKPQLTKSLRKLRERNMVATMKATHGTLITALNYEYYQDPKNYEGNYEEITEETRRQRESLNIDNNDKNVKNDKNKKDDFVSQIIESFQKSYFEIFGSEYVLMAKGKERAAASKILQLYKSKYPDANSEKTICDLAAFFKNCCMIPDDWLQKNMSLPIIVSKFNEINNKLKNGKTIKSAPKATNLGAIIDAKFDQ
jgi:hypothetical protein